MLCTECLIITKPTIRNTCKQSNLYADKIFCVAVLLFSRLLACDFKTGYSENAGYKIYIPPW